MPPKKKKKRKTMAEKVLDSVFSSSGATLSTTFTCCPLTDQNLKALTTRSRIADRMGWICPRCDASVNPDRDHCPCS